MIESQMIAYVALAGLMAHGLYVLTRGDVDSSPTDAGDDSGLWTSERFNQSGEGHERPFFLD
ncbi:hypothetical protein [Azospirillum soli]|uniref:hypothetical protein n=1 Tax=Azospirillum soli TaxID=1304799 RepID=UPI001AE19D61|nr:hypothetical protein [Azospirillum soli]MBP2314723.1 hypothetical protein [Azospirillum soli]